MAIELRSRRNDVQTWDHSQLIRYATRLRALPTFQLSAEISPQLAEPWKGTRTRITTEHNGGNSVFSSRGFPPRGTGEHSWRDSVSDRRYKKKAAREKE